MGIIPVFLGGNLGFFMGSILGKGFRENVWFQIFGFTGEYPSDINRRWYNIVGVPIIANVFSNIFVPHIKTLIGPLKMKIMVSCLGKGKVLQEDLNQMYM